MRDWGTWTCVPFAIYLNFLWLVLFQMFFPVLGRCLGWHQQTRGDRYRCVRGKHGWGILSADVGNPPCAIFEGEVPGVTQVLARQRPETHG